MECPESFEAMLADDVECVVVEEVMAIADDPGADVGVAEVVIVVEGAFSLLFPLALLLFELGSSGLYSPE